jgi:hypothetical protein
MADALRGTVLDSMGRPLASAVVRVYDAGTSDLSDIFSDEALTTPITNDGATAPLTEVDGSWGPYYTVNGRYDVKYLLAGYSFDNTDTANIFISDLISTPSTITAAHTFTGIVAHQGAETHAGVETHAGAELFTGTPVFNPGGVGPGFDLGVNAENQRIPGMTADKVWDGTALRDATATPGANKLVMSDAAGVVTSWGAPQVNAYASYDTVITSGLLHQPVFDTEVRDTTNCYNPAAANKFQPDVPGLYLVIVAVTFTAATSMSLVYGYFRKNATTDYGFRQHNMATPGGGKFVSLESSVLVYLNGTTDYLEFWAACTGGGAVQITGSVSQPSSISAVRVA